MKWALIGVGALLLLLLLRRPLGWLWRFIARSGVGLGALWLLQWVTPLLGVELGVNLVNGAVLGALGLPGLALLLMTQWVIR